MGKELFERNWVQAPSTTRASDGLGPLFNARSCAACHPGGGAAPISEDRRGLHGTGLVARFGDGAGGGDPSLGHQLQTDAITTHTSEGSAWLQDAKPMVLIEKGNLDTATGIGMRRAPTLAGRGLIAQVTDAAILALADPDDADGDGVSGRARLRGDAPGRFGWKAEHATLQDQVAAAFSTDMGLSSTRFPDHWGDCTVAQMACRTGFDGSDALGDGYELSAVVIDLVSAYVASLGRERPGDPEGFNIFKSTGCADCHIPEMATETGTAAIFSDLLLHDMGEGLKDGFDAPGVAAREWRTAPLIGLVTSRSRLLHDGRAATVEEAIGWHGGEAAESKARFEGLDAAARARLLEYVAGL